jgi:hypothetical protein
MFKMKITAAVDPVKKNNEHIFIIGPETPMDIYRIFFTLMACCRNMVTIESGLDPDRSGNPRFENSDTEST